jgi:hypothetical protein
MRSHLFPLFLLLAHTSTSKRVLRRTVCRIGDIDGLAESPQVGEMVAESMDRLLLERLWTWFEGPSHALHSVALEGPLEPSASVYELDALATACVAAATLAVAEVQAVRLAAALRPVRIERAHAKAAFRSERYFTALGWTLAPGWDSVAGDYRSSDGWIRLHTNYAHHRAAALGVLGVVAARESVEAAVAHWKGDDLETAIVDAGGCAAVMRSPEAWALSAQGQALVDEPLFAVDRRAARPAALASDGVDRAPLAGVRVLDLTRVIAGPVCTRVLAAYGADLLRIDPPGFEEVPALIADTTAGKRRAFLDLRESGDRATFEALVSGAHVLVHGYRPDALERLGFGAERLRALQPDLVVVCHDAYGWTGPWSKRRGFDSLVQMSCGIAWRGREVAANGIRPVPLPAQALDHGTGYLLAAAACRALTQSLVAKQASEVRLSLARTARLLMELGDRGDPNAKDASQTDANRWLEEASTAFGRVRRVRCPGHIDGVTATWSIPGGPLGVDRPAWREVVAPA